MRFKIGDRIRHKFVGFRAIVRKKGAIQNCILIEFINKKEAIHFLSNDEGLYPFNANLFDLDESIFRIIKRKYL